MKRLLISRLAEEDLRAIYTFLADKYSIETAERFRLNAEKAFVLLARHSEIGPHPAWATRHQKLRFWIVSRTNYIIYYESSGNEVSIERVLDGRRDVRRIIDLGLENPPENEDEE